MQMDLTPTEVSTPSDASGADAVRPKPQSLSVVLPAAVNKAADSEATEPPETEMLAPGDASSLYSAQVCLKRSCLTFHHSRQQCNNPFACCVC